MEKIHHSHTCGSDCSVSCRGHGPLSCRFTISGPRNHQRYDRPLLRLPTQLILSLGAMLSASSSQSAWLLPTPLGGSGTPRAVMCVPARLRGGYRLEGL